jgi:hypothetical protein
MTPQGRRVKQAAIDFGDGKTLPFTPCKKGYAPIVNGERKVACSIHNKERIKRLQKEGWDFRKGEVNLQEIFWSKAEEKVTEDKRSASKDIMKK